MITPVLMPQLGLEVSEARVIDVLVEIGAAVVREQPLLELETDKATTEVLAPCDGFVSTIETETGETVSVGQVLIRLATTAGERLDDKEPAASNGGSPATDHPERVRVAPVARRAAAEHGIDLGAVVGTGPRGRIVLADVRRAAEAAQPSHERDTAPARDELEPAAVRTELTAIRSAIARRMVLSQAIPQYHLVRDVDATHLVAEKSAQASRGTSGVGLNDLLLQALAETVKRHPSLSTAYIDGADAHLVTRSAINIGLAVATARGLVVPVIRNVDAVGLAAIAAERLRLVEQARGGRLPLDAMTGSVITLSNLAAAGVDRFTAMVSPGESAILAVGRTTDRLLARGRSIAIVPTLTLTMTFDHRVVDGAVGATALGELADLLEGAMAWRP